MEEEKKLIHNVFMTKSEVEEGFSKLYDEYGIAITLWDDKRKAIELSRGFKARK